MPENRINPEKKEKKPFMTVQEIIIKDNERNQSLSVNSAIDHYTSIINSFMSLLVYDSTHEKYWNSILSTLPIRICRAITSTDEEAALIEEWETESFRTPESEYSEIYSLVKYSMLYMKQAENIQTLEGIDCRKAWSLVSLASFKIGEAMGLSHLEFRRFNVEEESFVQAMNARNVNRKINAFYDELEKLMLTSRPLDGWESIDKFIEAVTPHMSDFIKIHEVPRITISNIKKSLERRFKKEKGARLKYTWDKSKKL